MKKVLNTLYITNVNRYLSLDGENVVVSEEGKEIGRVPLHNLEAIITFGYTGASPGLMGACAKRNVAISFLNQYGKFLARVSGEVYGNVTLRKEQYRISESLDKSLNIAKSCIIGKLYNSKWVLERAIRDHGLSLDAEKLKLKSQFLSESLQKVKRCETFETLRGLEGEAAAMYFSVFDDLILQQKEDFTFNGRNKRPPKDSVNAMLSFAYTLLAGMYASALESVGLDPYVGYLHTDRPGRISLALDMMEELRSVIADRFVITLINKRIVGKGDFIKRENGSVVMKDEARKEFLTNWQNRKLEIITHPFIEERMQWGMIPHIQAMLLARFIRGDIDAYPPFMWK